MKIALHVKDGYVAFACEGVLPHPPEKIVFDRRTRIFTMFFKEVFRPIEIDCPIDDEMMNAIDNNEKCGIGCFKDGKKLSGGFVPFEQIYES